MALAEQQDKSLAQLMQQTIFTPLKMPSATLTVAKGDKNYDQYAQGYDAKGKPARTAAGGLLSSSWGLKASLDDMSGYLKAAVGDPQVPPALLSAMQLAQTGYFQITTAKSAMQAGLGWFIIPSEKLLKSDFVWDSSRRPAPRPVEAIVSPQFNGNSLIDKTGATNGFRAYVGVIPDQRVGVVILTNKFIYHGGAVRDLGRTLLVDMTPLAEQLK
jgi:beta-lactamase class C